MYKKITIILTLLSVAGLTFLAFKYYQVQDYKLIANEKVHYLNAAANNFSTYGFTICVLIWLWVNVAAYKTSQFFVLWIPFLMVAFVAYKMGYHAQDIFVFKKQNGMWKGGFLVSYIASGIIIIGTSVILLLNYYLLKNFVNKNPR